MQIHEVTWTVRDDDIDMLGHVSNLAVARWVQEVAIDHSNAVGLSFEAYRAIGGVFVLRRHLIDYVRSAFLHEAIRARTWLAVARGASCERIVEFRREDVLIASSVTTWVYVTTGSTRPSRIPDNVRRAFGQSVRDVGPEAGA